MKKKYFLFCMTLSIFLAFSGCEKNEIPPEDIPYNQNLHNEDVTGESSEPSDNSKNESETDNGILDHSSQPTGNNNQDNAEEQPNGQDNAKEQPDDRGNAKDQPNGQDNAEKQSDVLHRLDENAYFLSTNLDFYEKIASNPIDRKYVMEEEAAPLEIWHSALEKCEAWNQQIDFTGSALEGLLSKADYDTLQNAISLWHAYYQEEVSQNRELYGNNGMILGSMYTAVSADVLTEKCRLTSIILLSQEYELSNNVSFAENVTATENITVTENATPTANATETENTTATNNATATDNGGEYSLSPQSFCIEDSADFEETIIPYSINEKDSDGLEDLIRETADKIEEKFGHDFAEHANQYVSFIHALYTVENAVSEDGDGCLTLKENRLKLYAVELLNIVYMMENQ